LFKGVFFRRTLYGCVGNSFLASYRSLYLDIFSMSFSLTSLAVPSFDHGNVTGFTTDSVYNIDKNCIYGLTSIYSLKWKNVVVTSAEFAKWI